MIHFHELASGDLFWFQGFKYVRTGANAARPVGERKDIWFGAHTWVKRA